MDVFTTAELIALLPELRQPRSYLLDKYFPTVHESTTEEIHFDTLVGKKRITPFVHPTVAGRVVQGAGYKTSVFTPAYAKDKRIFRPDGVLKRAAGEKIGGSLTPSQRMEANLKFAMDDQLKMLTMREEVMASEALRTGKVTVTGDGYDTVVVDFGRAAGQTVVLAGNDRWSVVHADSDPLGDLEAWAALIQGNGGGAAIDVTLAPDAWAAMRKRLIERGEAAMLLDYTRSGSSTLELGPGNDNARFIGRLGSFNLWTYDDVYVDDNGADQHLMPSGTVVMASASVEGVRAYGVIQDPKANYGAMRYFPKTWEEEDPAVTWLMLQSAPLVVPCRPNATLKASVLA
jgi:hypothetical protein